ncbi:hypothetical protein CEXT_699851 [Caerostris extrusa]|uniref:Uncharacterized protein n=1 Tax=Caerostris extrusa TaxID=172846 RepID=A0AAV4W129_CAEEX|nr:hypothetical protein CEXT_699851 [Caerostris extrusa]
MLPNYGFFVTILKNPSTELGKSSRGLISLSEVHHDTSARFHPPNPHFTPQVCPLLRLGKASPLSAMPSTLKDQGTMSIEGSLEIPLSALVPETGNSFKRETA